MRSCTRRGSRASSPPAASWRTRTPYADLAPTLMAGNYGPRQQDEDRYCGIHAQHAVGALRRGQYRRFRRQRNLGGDTAGGGGGGAVDSEERSRLRQISASLDAGRSRPQGAVRQRPRRRQIRRSFRQRQDRGTRCAGGKAPAKADDLRDLKLPPDAASFPILSIADRVRRWPRRNGPAAGRCSNSKRCKSSRSSRFETPFRTPRRTGRADRSAHRRPPCGRTVVEAGIVERTAQRARGRLQSPRGCTAEPTAPAIRALQNARTTRSDQAASRHGDHAGCADADGAPSARLCLRSRRCARISCNFGINEATISIDWEEDLKPGPVGEYLEVVDVDPASGSCYAPVDLNHPHMLAENGLTPSEANPQFHQQMCYAVAMRTIEHFERALGRKAMWSSRYVRDQKGNVTPKNSCRACASIRTPCAPRTRTTAPSTRRCCSAISGPLQAQAGTTLPGSRVFCAVSHDIVAHETTHALLDGLHRRYQEVHQSRRPRLPRGVCRHRRPVPALQHAGGA